MRIDDRHESDMRGIERRTGRRLASRVLGHRDHLESAILQALVDRLPVADVKPAATPRGPRDEQHLLAAIIRQTDDFPLAVRQFEVRGDG